MEKTLKRVRSIHFEEQIRFYALPDVALKNLLYTTISNLMTISALQYGLFLCPKMVLRLHN